MNTKVKYRTKDYFNEQDTYLFLNDSFNITFRSKVEFSKGYWWTVEKLQYKATTIPCVKL